MAKDSRRGGKVPQKNSNYRTLKLWANGKKVGDMVEIMHSQGGKLVVTRGKIDESGNGFEIAVDRGAPKGISFISVDGVVKFRYADGPWREVYS